MQKTQRIFASGLRRDAESSAVVVGDVNGFNVVTAAAVKEIFDSAVNGACGSEWLFAPNAVVDGKALTSNLREVSHIVDVGDAANVKPACNLCGSEAWKAFLRHNILQLGECHAQ